MKKLTIAALVIMLLFIAGCSSGVAAPPAANTPSPQPTASSSAANTPSPQPTAAASAANTPSLQPTAAVSEPAVSTSTEATAKATAQTTTDPAASDFKSKEVTLANVEAALKGLFGEGEYIGTDVENSGGVLYVTITYRPSKIQDENDFALQVGQQAAKVMQVLYTNEAVNVVTFKGDTATAEDIIEINMSKDTAATIDWTALVNQAQTDYKAVLAIADSHHIDASISDKLK